MFYPRAARESTRKSTREDAHNGHTRICIALRWLRRRGNPRDPGHGIHEEVQNIEVFAERHARLVSHTAKDRLAFALTSIASRAGHPFAGGVEVEIRNQDLASLTDVGLFTACRLLKQWERKGTVAKGRGKILIRCPERLLA